MAIYAVARFTYNGAAKTGLSPLLTIIKVSDNSVIVNAQAMSEVGSGFYKRDITSAISTDVDYVGYADAGSDAVDSRYLEIYFGDMVSLDALQDSVGVMQDDVTLIKGYTDGLQDDVTLIKGYTDGLQDDVTLIKGYVDDIDGDVVTGLTTFGAGTEAKQDLILAALEVSEGARLLEISIVRTGTATPIADVFVALYPALSDVLISTGKSDINGELSFSMDDGSYRLICYKVGYSFTNPTSVTITGNDTVEIEGDAIVIESPIPGSSCRVYEYLYDLSGVTPLAEERVVGNATAYVTPFDFNEDRLVEVEAVEGTYDESTGLIYWDIAQGATVSFRIPVVGISKTVLIPDESSARLYDLTLEEEES